MGIGKSSYISMCLDPDGERAMPEISKAINGTTKRVTSYSAQGFTLVDTPGLNGSKVDPMKYVTGIENYLNVNKKVNGFILVIGDLVKIFFL
jgi:putative ribosome biogenesis GTPase RsgA